MRTGELSWGSYRLTKIADRWGLAESHNPPTGKVDRCEFISPSFLCFSYPILPTPLPTCNQQFGTGCSRFRREH